MYEITATVVDSDMLDWWLRGFGDAVTRVAKRKIKKVNTEKNSTEEFRNLVRKFEALPHSKQGLTFMDVSGYPHYENVCSNILAFYLDPGQEHGLKDLFISALFKMTCPDTACSTRIKSVTREYGTTSGRLDILVEGEEFIIAIENKIFHWLANDLDDYAKAIQSRNDGLQKEIKIVLGLSKAPDSALYGGFVSCTYMQLWREISGLLGLYVGKANPKWLTYLLDFIETTTNLSGGNMEIKETDRFFTEHEEVILAMLKERNAYLKRLTKEIATLCDLMKDSTEKDFLQREPYPYSTDRLVLDFRPFQTKYEISFDFFLTPSGWSLQLFGRGIPAYQHLLTLVKKPPLESIMQKAVEKEKRFYVETWPVETDLNTIKTELCKWLRAVDEANRNI